MAVSVSNTVYGIIKDAMHDAGFLEEGQDPNSEQLSTYMRRLCDIINLWQTQGLKLFLLEEITVTLIASQNTYTLNTAPGTEPEKNLRVLNGKVVDTSGTTRPIDPIAWSDWYKLSQNNEGTVTCYLVDKQATSLNIRFWNTPSAQEALNTVVLLVQTQAENPFNLLSNVAFPQEWRIALRWGLADDICTGQPQAIMDRCAQRSSAYREALENWDVEDAPTSFAPDQRSAYSAQGRFR